MRSVWSDHIGQCALSTMVVIGCLCIFSFIKRATNQVGTMKQPSPLRVTRRVKMSESTPCNIIVKTVCCETLCYVRLTHYSIVLNILFNSSTLMNIDLTRKPRDFFCINGSIRIVDTSIAFRVYIQELGMKFGPGEIRNLALKKFKILFNRRHNSN